MGWADSKKIINKISHPSLKDKNGRSYKNPKKIKFTKMKFIFWNMQSNNYQND